MPYSDDADGTLAEVAAHPESDKARAYVERKKIARAKERERAKQRYRAQKAERMQSPDYRGPGRPTTADPNDPTRTFVMSRKIHWVLSALAKARSYTPGCDRQVTIRELAEAAMIAMYPEITAADKPYLAPEQQAALFSEIVTRAMAEPGDLENNWNGAGERIAFECPTPHMPNAAPCQFKVRDLAWWMRNNMEKAAECSTVRELAMTMVGWPREWWPAESPNSEGQE